MTAHIEINWLLINVQGQAADYDILAGTQTILIKYRIFDVFLSFLVDIFITLCTFKAPCTAFALSQLIIYKFGI